MNSVVLVPRLKQPSLAIQNTPHLSVIHLMNRILVLVFRVVEVCSIFRVLALSNAESLSSKLRLFRFTRFFSLSCVLGEWLRFELFLRQVVVGIT